MPKKKFTLAEQLARSIRSSQWDTANAIFTQLMMEKVSRKLNEERQTLLDEAAVYRPGGGWDTWQGTEAELKAMRDAYWKAYNDTYKGDFGNNAEAMMVNDEIYSTTDDPAEKAAAKRAIDYETENRRNAERAGENAQKPFDAALKKKWTELYGKDMSAYIKKRIAAATKANGGKKPTKQQLLAIIGVA